MTSHMCLLTVYYFKQAHRPHLSLSMKRMQVQIRINFCIYNVEIIKDYTSDNAIAKFSLQI